MKISFKLLFIVFLLVVSFTILPKVLFVFFIFFSSFLISSALDPFVIFLNNKGIPRSVTIGGFFILMLCLLLLLIITIIPFFRELIALTNQLPRILDKSVMALKPLLGNNTLAINNNIGNISKYTTQNIKNNITSIDTISKTALGIIKIVSSFISLIVLSIYLLVDKDQNYKNFSEFFPNDYQERVLNTLYATEKALGKWVQAQLLLSVIVFAMYYLSMSILKINFAFTISLLAGFLEVIPIAGPFISATIAFIIALLFRPDIAIIMLILSFIIQETEAHLLVPKIMQKVNNINPIITILSLILGTELFGITGAVLSVPLATTAQIIYLSLKK